MSHKTQQWIIERYRAITEELGLKDSIIQEIAEDIYDLTNLPKKGIHSHTMHSQQAK